MTWDEFESIIDNTTIELYSSEWNQLQKAFNTWKEKKEQEIDYTIEYKDDALNGDE